MFDKCLQNEKVHEAMPPRVLTFSSLLVNQYLSCLLPSPSILPSLSFFPLFFAPSFLPGTQMGSNHVIRWSCLLRLFPFAAEPGPPSVSRVLEC